MNERLRTTSILALLLANAARAGPPTVPVFEPDPMLHAPGGRIVQPMCADEEPHRLGSFDLTGCMISICPTTFDAFGSSIDGTQDGHTSIAIAAAPL